jgi:cytochrome c biogenesis protein CcmG, thiol:disulfide interchange protein DsbE
MRGPLAGRTSVFTTDRNRVTPGGRLGKLALYQLSYVRVGLIAGPVREPARASLRRVVSARALAAFLAVLAVIGLLVFGLLSKGTASLAVGDAVPDRELPLLGGEGQEDIARYRGHWVLVNLWASWCVPCRRETPVLDRFARRYRGRNVRVLGIDVQDNSDDALAFARRYRVAYPQLRSVGAERSEAFGSTGVPENFLVDPEGRLAFIWRGPVDEEILKDRLVPIVEGSK